MIQGFGAVGKHAARYLINKGAKIVAVADSQGGIHNPKGLDYDRLISLKEKGFSVADYSDGQAIGRDDVISVDCDIWIPAARPDVIHEDNAADIKAKLIVQGANIPATEKAEELLHKKGVLCVPDFIANAGGVICAAMEYHGANESSAMATIEEKIRRNTEMVLTASKEKHILPRQAAFEMASERVHKAMSFRRWSSFSSSPNYL